MGTLLLGVVVVLNLILLGLLLGLIRRITSSSQTTELQVLANESVALRESLAQKFSAATADMAMRLESTKGDLRQEVTDRLGEGFKEIRNSVEAQLTGGRREQTHDLREARAELTNSLALTTSQLKAEFENLNLKTAQSLHAIRDRVDAKLLAISGEVQQTLDQNIKEGFAEFVRVMKAEAKRIKAYIQPEHGTTDIALMYLPSETLYMEAVRNRELADWLNAQHVFPVSPNTLLMTLQTIALVHKWYEVAIRFEKSRLELAKAQKSFDFFQNQFESVGKSLGKAQEAFDKASTHLKTYRGRVTALSGQEQLELDSGKNGDDSLPLADKASA